MKPVNTTETNISNIEMTAGDIELDNAVQKGVIREITLNEGGASGEEKLEMALKYQDCGCLGADLIIGLTFLVLGFINFPVMTPLFIASANVLTIVWGYLAGIRIVQFVISLIFYCMPRCAGNIRNGNKCFFFLLSLLATAAGIAMLENPQARLFLEKAAVSVIGLKTELKITQNLLNITAAIQGKSASKDDTLALANSAAAWSSGPAVAIMRGLCYTTLVVQFILPCLINCCFLCQLARKGEETVQYALDNPSTRVYVNNTLCMMRYIGCINKDA
jgi:hypothetical protein